MGDEKLGFVEVVVDAETFGYTAVGNGDHRAPATEIFLAADNHLFWIEGGAQPALQDTGVFEGLYVWSAVFGDFTGSGALDFLARSPDAHTAKTGDGQGGFEAISLSGLELENDEVAADFNNDGLDDLYRIRWDGDAQVSVLEVLLNTSR